MLSHSGCPSRPLIIFFIVSAVGRIRAVAGRECRLAFVQWQVIVVRSLCLVLSCLVLSSRLIADVCLSVRRAVDSTHRMYRIHTHPHVHVLHAPYRGVAHRSFGVASLPHGTLTHTT